MRATGIVRRIDDLGRVVIPKEIRRSLKIKEGEPLEIFTTSDGCVCFKKYLPYADVDFAKAFNMVKVITKFDFAIFDPNGECVGCTSQRIPLELQDTTDECHFVQVTENYDEICTVAVDPDMPDTERKQIAEIIKILARED